MQINADIEKPTVELSVRPVTGLSCLREEPSGKKFWTLMRDIFHDNPDTFAAHNFVHNLCPLAFFAASGRNITPPELKVRCSYEVHNVGSLYDFFFAFIFLSG